MSHSFPLRYFQHCNWNSTFQLKTHQHHTFSDGSSGYSEYRYRGSDVVQNNLFVSSLTVLRLVAEYKENGQTQKNILFQNLMPNSPYAVSPLRFKFEPETTSNYLEMTFFPVWWNMQTVHFFQLMLSTKANDFRKRLKIWPQLPLETIL